MITTAQIGIFQKLEDRWDFFRSLHGSNWPMVVADYEAHIRVRMAEDKCDVLPAALTLGKMLSNAGKDPNELFAAAVEILKRQENQAAAKK